MRKNHASFPATTKTIKRYVYVQMTVLASAFNVIKSMDHGTNYKG